MSRRIEQLPNLGPVMAHRLREIGICTEDDLQASGSARAFVRLRAAFGRSVTLNALYAMEGALLGVDWTELRPERKAELRTAAALEMKVE